MPKLSFKERCPLIIGILHSAPEPLGFNEIHAGVKRKAGVTISYSTLKKCLEYLTISGQINKTVLRAPGSPTRYSINDASFLSKFDDEIQYIAWLYNKPEMSGKIDSVQALYVSDKIRFLLEKLINELYEYSNCKKSNEASTKYKTFLDAALIPCLFELRNLVKPGLVMSDETRAQLLDVFVNSYFRNMLDATKKRQAASISQGALKEGAPEKVELKLKPETLALFEEAKELSKHLPRSFDRRAFDAMHRELLERESPSQFPRRN